MTDEIYDYEITSRYTGKPKNKVPWVILFMSEDDIDSMRAYAEFKSMALNRKGQMRFGWVNRHKNELLSASFNARYMP